MATRELAKANPSFSYQVYLGENPKGAAKELDSDVRSAIRSCAHVGNSVLPAQFLKKGLEEIPVSGIMTEEVEDYMVKSYKKQSFYNS